MRSGPERGLDHVQARGLDSKTRYGEQRTLVVRSQRAREGPHLPGGRRVPFPAERGPLSSLGTASTMGLGTTTWRAQVGMRFRRLRISLPVLKKGTRFCRTETCASARIAPSAGWAVLDRKGPEPAQFDPISPRQRGSNRVQNTVDDVFDVTLVEMRILRGDALDQCGFDHSFGPPGLTAVTNSGGPPHFLRGSSAGLT
jgi:hypothetical protein